MLRRGEVYLEVVPDSATPFTVEAGSHRVTVTGTEFNVRYRRGVGNVTVHEGSVDIVTTSVDEALADVVELTAGQHLRLQDGAVPESLTDDELRRLADWRNGWLHFDSVSLGMFAEELAPYVEKRIVLTSRSTEQLLVGGSFNVDRLDLLWATLESVIPVEISEDADRIVISYDIDRGT